MKTKLTIKGQRVSVKKFCAEYDISPEQIEVAVGQYVRSKTNRLKREATYKAKHGITYSADRLKKRRLAELNNRKAAEARQVRDLASRQPN